MSKPSAAETAKAALRRLAMSKLEPTPENYARAWGEEGGPAPATAPAAAAPAPAAASPKAKGVHDRIAARLFEDGTQREEFAQAMQRADWDAARAHVERAADAQLALAQGWAQTIEKLARGLERGGRQWTAARKKDSLQRVLDANRSDIGRLHQRMKQLVASWDGDVVDDTVPVDEAAAGDQPSGASAPPAGEPQAAERAPAAQGDWPPVLAQYDATLHVALPADDERAVALAGELRELQASLQRDGATAPLRALAETLC
jgi:diguanylate cyclase